MPELPFDLEHPPADPPPEVRQPMLWRLAVRLHRDHEALPDATPSACRTCGEAWPCQPRRLAERALIAALRPGHDEPRGRPPPRMIRGPAAAYR